MSISHENAYIKLTVVSIPQYKHSSNTPALTQHTQTSFFHIYMEAYLWSTLGFSVYIHRNGCR
jgi:hypothetical protein